LDDAEKDVTHRLMAAALAACTLLLADGALAQRPGQAHAEAAADRSLTLAERQAAWSANKEEYRRRVAKDGQASADRWLDQKALAARPAEPRKKSQARSAGKKDCKKVRWVNRATPGFGGGAMTMSRIPVCAD